MIVLMVCFPLLGLEGFAEHAARVVVIAARPAAAAMPALLTARNVLREIIACW
jgi:hypothetical protein